MELSFHHDLLQCFSLRKKNVKWAKINSEKKKFNFISNYFLKFYFLSKNSILTKLIWIFASKLFKWFSNNWIFAQKSNFLNMKFWGKCWFEIFWRKKLWFSNTVQVHKKPFFLENLQSLCFFFAAKIILSFYHTCKKTRIFHFLSRLFIFP